MGLPAGRPSVSRETNRKGIYMVGCCRDEMDFPGAIQDGTVAAGEIYELFGQGALVYEEDTVKVQTEKCVFCLTCVRICPHGAAEIDLVQEAAFINPAACQACGMCAADCPAQAIVYKAYDNTGIMAQLELGGEIRCGLWSFAVRTQPIRRPG